MTAPEPPGGPSPLRVGGLALVGVAVVSAIIGLTTIATGNGDVEPTAAAPAPPTTSAPPAEVPPPSPVPPTSAAVPPPPPGALQTSDATVPVPPFVPPDGVAAPPVPGAAPAPAAPVAPAPVAPAPGVPGAPGAPAAGGNGSGGAGAGIADGGPAAGDRAVAARAPLRVYNNSTISGLAARAADDFRNAGWPVEVVDNYPYGIIPTSTVYFRPGTNEEAPAKELGAEFGMRVSPRFDGLQDASPGLIVIVTNDYRRSAS